MLQFRKQLRRKMASKSHLISDESFASVHHSPYYDQDISLDTWFICDSKLILFSNFQLYALNKTRTKWYKLHLKVSEMLECRYGYGNYILLTSAFNNTTKTLYIFGRHYKEKETALIQIKLKTLQCAIAKCNMYCEDCYGVVIQNQFHIIHSNGHLVWNETMRQFNRIRDLRFIHWDSKCICISNKHMMLLFDTHKLYGYSLLAHSRYAKMAMINIHMPYARMRDYGIAHCVKGRYVLMFAGLYKYGLKSHDIFIYDLYQNAFGFCSVKAPVKGKCRVMVNTLDYDDRIIAGYMRKYVGHAIYEIVQLTQSVYLYKDIIYVFPNIQSTLYWEIDADVLIENTCLWIPCVSS
eukprot:174447_1